MSLINTNVTVLEVNQNTINKPFEVGYKGDHNAYKLVFSDLVGDGYSVLFWKPMSNHCVFVPLVNNEWLLGNEVLSTSGTLYCQVVKKDESNNFIKHSQVFMLSVNESAPCTQQAFEEVPPNFKIAYDEMVAITKKVNEALTSGKFNGLSAYELAVKNGFEGTEAEWIESLKYWNSPEFTKLAEQVRADKEHVDTVVAEFDTKANQANTDFDTKVNTANTEFDKKVADANNAFDEKVKTANDAFDKKVTDADTNFTGKVNKANTDLDTKVTQINQDLDAKETAINQALDAKITEANSVIDTKVQESDTSAENAKKSELKAQAIADNMQGLTNAFRIDTSEQGRVITATDSSENVINGLKVYGESTQVQTNGYQLFDANEIQTKSQGGITLTNNGDGSLTISGNGTPSESFAFVKTITNSEILKSLKPGNLNLVGGNADGNPYFEIEIKANGKTNNLRQGSVNITEAMLSANDFSIKYLLIGYTSKPIKPTTFKPMLYQNGNGTWEPFTNCKQSPSPELPQDIISKTVSEITVGGSQLLDVNAIKQVTIADNNNNYGYELNLPKGRYIVNTDRNAVPEGKENYLYINKKDAKGMFGNPIYVVAIKSVYKNVVFDVFEGETVYFYNAVTSSSLETTKQLFEYYKFMLNEGSNALPYEPYKQPQTVTFSQPITLYSVKARNRAVPNVTIDGVKYLSDVITEKDGVYGVERNCYTTTTTTATHIGIYETKKGFYVKNAIKEVMDRDNGYCNIATISYGSSIGKDNIWLGVQNTNAYILNSSFWDDSLDDKGLNNFMEFLKETPLVIVTHYKNPVFEPLPEADQQAIKALKSNYPTTVVTNNDNAFMQLDYVADTKNYIDNRLSEIKTAIIASKGV